MHNNKIERKSSSARMKVNKSNARSSSKESVETAKASGDCSEVSVSSSHSQYFGKKRRTDEFRRITRNEYYDVHSDTSSESFGCIHGPEGKLHTESEQLRQTFVHVLDPIPADRAWNECPSALGWDMARKLEFLVTDTSPLQQLERLNSHLLDFARTSRDGYKIDVLDSVCVVLDFLETAYSKEPSLREPFELLLKNMHKPILLNKNTDIVTYFDNFANFMGFLGCLMVGLEEDCLFSVVSAALLWHLSAPDEQRPPGTVKRRTALVAAAPTLYDSAVRMLAVSSSYRFPAFLQMALLLACDSRDNCIQLLKGGIIENIFYRFDPCFSQRKLPAYDSNPVDPQDYNVQLGDSSVHFTTTLTLLLVLLTKLKQCCDENATFCKKLPSPDNYAQSCFIRAFKYECRARGRQSQRVSMTVIASSMVQRFGRRLELFFPCLMLDVLSLSVATELPVRSDWVGTVNFNTSQIDVQFKKVLICLSIDFVKAFPFNNFLLQSRHWVMGLMYLLDPVLAPLRAKWSHSLYDELRLMALQALVCAMPYIWEDVPRKCGLITRLMWYIEWYSSSPYELPLLYWCVRLIRATTHRRGSVARKRSLQDLFDTHGVIILMNLCTTLLGQTTTGPPVEMRQVILGLSLRLLTGAAANKARVYCAVYPEIKWPHSINNVARTMMDVVLQSLAQGYFISDRWLISILNFIWEGIVWKDDYRISFVANNGVHQLLDIVTELHKYILLTKPAKCLHLSLAKNSFVCPAVLAYRSHISNDYHIAYLLTKMARVPLQCAALAVVCDIVRAGAGVAQLVTWRASSGASHAHPRVVMSGSTIATLLASVFRDECQQIGVVLDVNGVIQDLNYPPLRSHRVRMALEHPKLDAWLHNRTPVCYAAADLAGSRMSKAFALLQLLSEDLQHKASLADKAYNLYKHIPLATKDEVILVLCSHYLTLKLMETWAEVKMQSPHVDAHDGDILDEFLHISNGWTVEIKRQQEAVIEMDRKKERDEESSLYSFLARVRVNTALDALREVRCAARAGDRTRLTHALLVDAVRAHHRRSTLAQGLDEPVRRTFDPALDDQNITGQYVKTYIPKKIAKK